MAMAKINGNGKSQKSKVNLILILILKKIYSKQKAHHFQLTRFLLYGFITTN
jgi:hypothetical protein